MINAQLALFGSFGWQEILLILLLALLLFGSTRLPELARSLARALKGFKEEMHEAKDEIEKSVSGEGETRTAKKEETEEEREDSA